MNDIAQILAGENMQKIRPYLTQGLQPKKRNRHVLYNFEYVFLVITFKKRMCIFLGAK